MSPNSCAYFAAERLFYLAERSFFSVLEIQQKFYVSRQTVMRDIRFLKERLFFKIEYDRQHKIYKVVKNERFY